MNVALVKALIILIPVGILLAGSVTLFLRRKSPGRVLQLLGAALLVIVVLTHVSEALHLFPSFRWGDDDSIGHYLDLSSAILGFTPFPLGYLLEALAKGASS